MFISLLTTAFDALRPDVRVVCMIRTLLSLKAIMFSHRMRFHLIVSVSFVERAWIDIPNVRELCRMNDYHSNIDIAMHVAHQKNNWEKGNENEENCVSWTRSEYIQHVAATISDQPTIAGFLNSFRGARAESTRPARQSLTPNDRSRGPPKSRADEREDQIRNNIAERLKNSMRKAAQKEFSKTTIDFSTSESESIQMAQPVKPILAKPMPKKETWQKKSDIPESSAAASSSSASASKSAVNPAKEDRRKPVKGLQEFRQMWSR